MPAAASLAVWIHSCLGCRHLHGAACCRLQAGRLCICAKICCLHTGCALVRCTPLFCFHALSRRLQAIYSPVSPAILTLLCLISPLLPPCCCCCAEVRAPDAGQREERLLLPAVQGLQVRQRGRRYRVHHSCLRRTVCQWQWPVQSPIDACDSVLELGWPTASPGCKNA